MRKLFNPKKDTLSPRDIARLIPWKDVAKSLGYHYSYTIKKRDIESYKDIYERIRDTNRVVDNKGEKLECYTREFYDAFEENPDMRDGGYYGIHTIDKKGKEWGLSFRRWNATITMPFTQITLEHHTFADMLAHYIWEISWYGNEKQSLEFGAGLREKAKKVIAQVSKKKK